MFYGRTQYDPVYIIAQIASIQAIFYVTLGALLWVLVGKGKQCTICPCRRRTKVDLYPHCRAICWQAHPILHLQQCLAQGWWLDGGAVKLGDSCCNCHLYCNHCKYVWRIYAFLVDGTVLQHTYSCIVAHMQIERAKKCLDFSFTVYFIHVMACICYAGVPHQWQWY